MTENTTLSKDEGSLENFNGPKILLEGPSGSGKTYSVGTLVDWAFKNGERQVFMIFAEQGMETLIGYWKDKNLPVPPNFHYSAVKTSSVGFEDLLKNARNIGKMDYKNLANMSDPNRGINSMMDIFLSKFLNFIDQNGTEFGPLDKLPVESIVVVDSLTALNYYIERLICGTRPVMAQGEYMVAQKFIYNFLFKCTQSMEQTFVLIAHVDKIIDEVYGGLKLMTKAPGNKLAPEIPIIFSEVILTVRSGDNYYWDTASESADLKSRYLPRSQKNLPSFAPIMDLWLKRRGEK